MMASVFVSIVILTFLSAPIYGWSTSLFFLDAPFYFMMTMKRANVAMMNDPRGLSTSESKILQTLFILVGCVIIGSTMLLESHTLLHHVYRRSSKMTIMFRQQSDPV
jgi:hypothetical protein